VISAISRRIRKELCPYCFKYFRLGITPFRCKNSNCKKGRDPVRERKPWEERTPLGKVLKPAGFFRFAHKVSCPDCREESRTHLCPKCHSELPDHEYKNYIFSVIGAKGAGKSHYIAVLINQIMGQYGYREDILLSEKDDYTINRYRNDFKAPVFNEKQTINVTRSALTDANTQRPLIFSLDIKRKRFLLGDTKNIVNLIFFDTAGEDLNDSDVMSTVNRYIYRSDGIILLIDPLQLSRVRERLRLKHSGIELPEQNTDTAEILIRTTNLIRNGKRLKGKDRISIPLAIAFSKFDAVQPIIGDDQLSWNNAPCHRGGFDWEDFSAVNDEMEYLLKEEWKQGALLQRVRSWYSKYGFFGLSALGSNPCDSRIDHIAPIRVLDPFLWLLAQHKLIRQARDRRK